MNRMSKAALARHLTTQHGNTKSQLSLDVLRQQTRAQLEAEHERLLRYGPCSEAETSFRDRIVAK